MATIDTTSPPNQNKSIGTNYKSTTNMKFFAVLLVSVTVMGAFAVPLSDTEKLEKATGAQKLDMKEVEKLLQQIEAEEHKPKPDDGTVSESLQKLFATFRQMTGAYMNVLNAVNKSLGLPKYPAIPGLGRAARQDDQTENRPPLPLRQIQENLGQLQTAAVEVGQLVRRVVSNMSKDSRKTVLNQFQKFTNMWSNQLSEISNMLGSASENYRQDDQQQQNILQRINKYIQQVIAQIRDYGNNLYENVRNRITPTGGPQIAIANGSSL